LVAPESKRASLAACARSVSERAIGTLIALFFARYTELVLLARMSAATFRR
jgi:hypothetical protein